MVIELTNPLNHNTSKNHTHKKKKKNTRILSPNSWVIPLALNHWGVDNGSDRSCVDSVVCTTHLVEILQNCTNSKKAQKGISIEEHEKVMETTRFYRTGALYDNYFYSLDVQA